jgi:DNA repair protein RadC
MIPSPFDEPAVCILETKLCSTAVSSGRLLSGPAVCAALLHELVGLSDREEFVALLLNARHRVTHAHRVSRGTLVSASVHPREVFKAAVLANAAAMVVGHNHPSGDPRESAEDRAMVQRLRDAGTLLGIEVLDSIIVTPQGVYFSASDGCTGQLNRTQVPEVADGP